MGFVVAACFIVYSRPHRIACAGPVAIHMVTPRFFNGAVLTINIVRCDVMFGIPASFSGNETPLLN